MSAVASYAARARTFWSTIVEAGIETRPLLVRHDLSRREHIANLSIDRSKPLHVRLERLLQSAHSTFVQTLVVWSALWSECGFPQIVVGQRTAASFMATTMSRETVASEARLPWRAFLIQVPPGLLEFPARPELDIADAEPITRVHVVQWNKGDLSILMSSPLGVVAMTACEGLCDLGEDSADEVLPAFGMVLSDSEKRALLLIGRLVLGSCLEMSAPDALGPVAAHGRRLAHSGVPTEPAIWTYTIRRDVKIDIRDAVRSYARGDRATSPTVKALVRGHWKRQRCGPGAAETKVIHVEPYWRGPEDVPVAVRKHIID
jgi:hypothetical protein